MVSLFVRKQGRPFVSLPNNKGLADLKEYRGTARLFGVQENSEAVDELCRKLLTEFQPPATTLRLTRLACKLGRDALDGKVEPPDYAGGLTFAVFNLLHAIEDLATLIEEQGRC